MTEFYYYHDDKVERLGKVTNVVVDGEECYFESTEPQPVISGSFTIELTRKNKKAWAKIFRMPKWELTEWMFPRKKKRASKRRKRKEQR